MTVDKVPPSIEAGSVLAGAQFTDAFRVSVDGINPSARRAAERLFARNPGWIDALLRLRNTLVRPFGLKTSGLGEPATGGMIGIFPVISETPERIVAGFDDRHLDFRVVVDVAPSRPGHQVTATTLVKTHNLLGRAYLAVVLPFHRVIIRSLLRHAFLSSKS
ncbi:MAG: DUF2867 domain-containing protein [Bradyrhizobium sp.]|nr:DUF2867 domain-containing protein [Bradyrhizobium sp.]